MKTIPLDLTGWTVERAHRVLGQLAARELNSVYSLATRNYLRRAAIATLATKPLMPHDPDAQVLSVTLDRHGVRSVTCGCPWCGRIHVHGWPQGTEGVGHRLSHCGAGGTRGGYNVVGES
jgi:hypothetical protein